MRFDPVHDTQRIFRALITAHSFPGTVVDISAEAGRVDLGASLSPALLALALTLLDTETSFCLLPRGGEDLEAMLSRLTGCPAADPAAARFLLAPAAGGAGREALAGAGIGTLEEPWLGATVILETARIAEGGDLLLEGPGIASRASLSVEGLDPSWVRLRHERCAAYPRGLDLVLVDSGGRLAAVPRTCAVWTEG